MGVYNGEKTVVRALNSILNGTYTDIEVIVCDDASTDRSAELIKEIADERLALLENDKNEGLGYALNKCLKVAKGEYIARMDADDFSLPDRLEKQLEFLSDNRKYDFCGADAYLMWEGKRWGKISYPKNPDKDLLLKRCPFIHPTMFFKREALEAVGGYASEKKYIRCEDYELYFRLYEKGFCGGNLNEALLEYSEPPYDVKKHTFKSRRNERRVRREGARRLKAGFKGYLMSFYPILLYFMPNFLYKRLRNKKWLENNNSYCE